MKIIAVELIIGATLVDLWRIMDSTGDLFTSSNGGLTIHQMRDDINDFRLYFAINVLVVMFAIVAACLRDRPAVPRG